MGLICPVRHSVPWDVFPMGRVVPCDVLFLGSFCPLGHLVIGTFCPLGPFFPWDALSVGHYVTCLWDGLY